MPVRLRLTLAFAAGMVVVLAGLGAFLYLRLGEELLDSIDLGLRSRAQVVQAGIDDDALADHLTGLSEPDEAFAQVLDASGSILDSSPEVADVPLVDAADLPVGEPTFWSREVAGLEEPARVLVVPAGRDRFVVVGSTLSDREEALEELLTLFAVGGPAALVLTSIAGWVLAGAALRPVDRMREEAAAISASEPERRLPMPPGGDELARLASTLNAMLGRLQEALERERRFVDDASHELRTPLGILTGELELALSRPRSAAELEATVRRASAEADRLARLAEDLLVLARAQGGRLPVHRRDVSIRALVAEASEGRQSRAAAAGVTIVADVGDRRARVDPARVRQALENLLDNAIRHTSTGGTVRVSSGEADGRAWIRVDDDGPGFPPALLPRAFEPFAGGGTRTDGAGLGLAIVRAVARSHGGEAIAENRPGGGARVTIEVDGAATAARGTGP